MVPLSQASATTKYKTYEGCMFDQMQKQQTETAAKLMEKICKTFPTKAELKQKIKAEKEKRELEKKNKTKKEIQSQKPDYVTTYFEFPGTFTVQLLNSRRFLQVGLGVSTQYDDIVMSNIETNQLQVRSAILNRMAEFSEADIQGASGREQLAISILGSINDTQVKAFGFGGIQAVHFTSFILQ